MSARILIEHGVQPINCPDFQSEQILKNGKVRLQDRRSLQKYVCKACGKQFNERTGTPMSRLRSTPESLSLALNVRTEGLGLRATGRVLGKSHATIIRWERRLAAQVVKFTLASARTFPPSESSGWTIHFIERETRYWAAAQAGLKTADLFERGTVQAWAWAQPAEFIRWFTDGERRYGKALWKLASVYLKAGEVHPDYGHRKVWRFGLEVAMKIKGSQGRKRVEWVKVEHPCTAISAERDVHANHNKGLA